MLKVVAIVWYSMDSSGAPGTLAIEAAIVASVQKFAGSLGFAIVEEAKGKVRFFGLTIPDDQLADRLLELRRLHLLAFGQTLSLEPSLDVEIDSRTGSALLQVTDEQMALVLRRIARDHDTERRLLFESPLYLPGRHFDPSTNRPLQPHVSLDTYLRVMGQLQRADSSRYALMHKGTPFYLMGWLGYDIGDYERGVFYMDAALSEDVQNNPKWDRTPAAAFIFLDPANTDAAARDVTIQMRAEISRQLERFLRLSGTTLSIDDFIARFVRPDAANPTHRSIVTALLTFVLEGRNRQEMIVMRSAYGGSLEPFLTHLFKGGLVFESILKRLYGTAGKTLGAYLAAGAGDLSLTKSLYAKHAPYALSDLPKLLGTWQSEVFHERSVAIAYAVRNTSGHDLGWQDIFVDPSLYSQLFEGVLDAVFWTIARKY
jgi:hypothetical protein